MLSNTFLKSEMFSKVKRCLSKVWDIIPRSKDDFLRSGTFPKVKYAILGSEMTSQGQRYLSQSQKIPLQGQKIPSRGKRYLSNFMHAFPRSYMLLNSQICLCKVKRCLSKVINAFSRSYTSFQGHTCFQKVGDTFHKVKCSLPNVKRHPPEFRDTFHISCMPFQGPTCF